MSLTSNELNYLIWRYLQEAGHELSSFAIQNEANILDLKLDSMYGDRVPMGTLVDLVQKGILYNKVNDVLTTAEEKLEDSAANGTGSHGSNREKLLKLVDDELINLNINLFNAIIEESNNPVLEDSLKGNLLTSNGHDNNTNINKQTDEMDEDMDDELNNEEEQNAENSGFISIAESYALFPNSLSNTWNPKNIDIVSYSHSNVVSIYNDKTKETLALNHPAYCKEIVLLSYSPNGRLLLTATMTGELRIWDSATGILKSILALHKSPVLTVKWNDHQPDYLLSLDVSNRAIIWNINTGNSIQLIDLNNPASSPKVLSLASNATVPTTNNSAATNLGTDACWIDYTKFVLPGLKSNLLVYNIGEAQPLGVLAGHMDSISGITYNFETKLLASASDDNTIRIWQGDSTNSMKLLVGHSQPITFLKWINLNSKDCLREKGDVPSRIIPIVISASLDGTIKIWDMKTGEIVSNTTTENGSPIYQASITNIISEENSMKLATGDSENSVIVWDVSLTRLNKLYYKFNKYISQRNSLLSKRHKPQHRLISKKVLNQKLVPLQLYQPKEEDEGEGDNEDEKKQAITTSEDDGEESNYISCLNWSSDNSKLFISYSKARSCIIKV